MNGRRLLALAAPLSIVAIGAPAFAYFVPDYSEKVAATASAAPPSKSPYILKAGKGPDAGALGGMAENLETTGVQDLLNQKGGRTGKWGGSCGSAAKVPAGAKVFCFNSADTKSKEWYPQGMTGVSDAQDDEKWGSEKPLLVSWYDADKKAPHKSARVTFINTKDNTYRHVLLVWPYQNADGKTTFEPVGAHGSDTGIHAGGIAWYGNRLYVADTNTGLRVFDMRQIFDLGKSENGSTGKPDQVGLEGKTYYGYGYRYVMPQVLSYVPNKQSGGSCTANGTPNHSWLSINRTGSDRLVTGERCKNGNGRVAQYQLTSDSGTNDLETDAAGRATPSSVARLPVSYVQGGTASDGTWWFTRNVPQEEQPYAAGQNKNQGQLIQAVWSNGFKDVKRESASFGPEDLHCWRGANQVWALAEHPGQRAVYGMKKPQC
ncbi:hypothetical protein GCM10010191_35360 [Actinomadura vinacea]|uniref:Secreted protein n=1 Tax=Actinomadura vinacea TaxID=115336 RepID=A0ABN3J4A0_9ACTN